MNLAIQIESGNGCILKVEGIVTRDFWLDFPDIEAPHKYVTIKPSHIASIIRQARKAGWVPEEAGAPFLFQASSAILQA